MPGLSQAQLKTRGGWVTCGMVAPYRAGLGCQHAQGDSTTPISLWGCSRVLAMNYPLAFPFQARGPRWGEPCTGLVPVPGTRLAVMLVLFAGVLGALGDPCQGPPGCAGQLCPSVSAGILETSQRAAGL